MSTTPHMDRTPQPQVWPSLRARDARALIRFLTEAFGFEEIGPQTIWPEAFFTAYMDATRLFVRIRPLLS